LARSFKFTRAFFRNIMNLRIHSFCIGNLRIGSAAALLAAVICVSCAHAQGWQPARSVRWVVPYVPGGANDLVTRIVAEPLGAALGQQFVVDNRAGASGTIAFDLIANAAPDGYTLMTAADAITILPSAFKKLSFDPRTSFAPITVMTTQPMALAVNIGVPVKSVKELIAFSKTKPGGLSYGTSGMGTSQHLCGELIKRATGIDMTHISYKGAGQAIIDLAGGQLQVVLVGSSTVISQQRAGRARILAVTSAKRSAALPDVPTLAEAGVPGFDIYHWIGMFGPARLPKEIVARLNAEIGRILATPAVRERLAASGLEAAPSTPQQLEALVHDGMERWGKLIADLKLELN
jgi:tripartite-type tricarboxylate transporter receptor subunit TctC